MAEPSLSHLLATLDQGTVWRPVRDAEGRLLADGTGCPEDGLGQGHGLDFAGKTVADLGCNVGSFSLLAARQGAALAHGFEIDHRLCRAARALAREHGLDNVAFFAQDFVTARPSRTYDMVLLVDVIGKRGVAKGELTALLDSAQRFTSREIILTVRPRYRIGKDLRLDEEAVKRLYGPEYVRNGMFLCLNYVVRHLGAGWAVRPLPRGGARGGKLPIRCVAA